MSVAGIDVSTKSVDIVLLDEDCERAAAFSFPLPGGWWAGREVGDTLPPRSSEFWDRITVIGIEDPYGVSKDTIKKMAMVTGAVLSHLPPGRKIVPLAPEDWKRETCGVPSAAKDEVAQWVGRTWDGIPALATQDTLDAYAIAWAARAINERAVEAQEAR